MKREIEKNPQPPKLSSKAIELLTELCFVKDHIEPADLIFEFSSFINADVVSATIERLLDRKLCDTVMITGGISHYSDAVQLGMTEADYVLDRINRKKYSNVRFFTEKKSTNLLENVSCALDVLDFRNFGKIIYITKAHAARRSYLTLRKYAPKAQLFQASYVATYPGDSTGIDRESWHTQDFGRRKVWGEFLRIKQYGSRGDIALDEKVNRLINQVDVTIAN